ncbi:hypothetical protein [Actinoplanes xinjiangensis]|uniref:hypothetical protein n=1 Tax=Actinoplanes xinjiangensis TaxID=512350 RepID=UPI003425F30F
MAPGSNGWFRRRSPRLSGTLHIRDADGRELVVPLRGRASLLTTSATRLRGHGEVWAVHTTAPAAETSLMIIYGRGGTTDLSGRAGTTDPSRRGGTTDSSRRGGTTGLSSGLCAAGQTIVLDGVTFTWRAPGAPANIVPRQRTAPQGLPRNRRTPPARSSNARSEPVADGGLRSRLRNMVRVVTQATRH